MCCRSCYRRRSPAKRRTSDTKEDASTGDGDLIQAEQYIISETSGNYRPGEVQVAKEWVATNCKVTF